MQNFIYALIQVIHNLGAATALATSASALWLARGNAGLQHRLAWFMASAWAIQAATGVLFGITTYFFEGHLPDIHGVAVDALVIKAGCAATGFVLAVACAQRGLQWAANRQVFVWRASLTLSVIALGSAAFLRWFS